MAHETSCSAAANSSRRTGGITMLNLSACGTEVVRTLKAASAAYHSVLIFETCMPRERERERRRHGLGDLREESFNVDRRPLAPRMTLPIRPIALRRRDSNRERDYEVVLPHWTSKRWAVRMQHHEDIKTYLYYHRPLRSKV